MPKFRPASVDAYIEALPKGEAKVFRAIRKAVRKAAPEAVEKIAYGVPVYFDHGWLVSYKSGKNFCSFMTMSFALPKKFARELKNFEISGTTVHFSVENPLSTTLVEKIVKERLKQNIERKRVATTRKSTPRKRVAMPSEVKRILENAKLMSAYKARPPYQQNDYLGWIGQAKQEETKEKRIRIMLSELRMGDVYMGMEWKGKKR